MSLLLAAALSYRQLDPDSTTPTPSSSGETRTTASIVWSCLSMVILCTWTSVRPNVPCVSRSGHWALVCLDNAKIFLVALIAPELIVLWSIRQRFAARGMVKEYQKYGWTITHAFFALMGGFALFDSEGNFLFHLWDQQFCYREQHGQFGYDAQLQKLRELHPQGDDRYKSPLEYCVANKMIIITEDEIANLGHTDILAKIITMIQTLYFIANCIARGVSGLAITELESFTLGFATLNLVSYSFWWHKPSRVRFPVRIMVPPKSLSPQPSPDTQDQNEETKSMLRCTGIPAMPSEAGILSAFSNRIRDDYGRSDSTRSLRGRILWILLLPLRAAGRTIKDATDLGWTSYFEHGNLFLAGTGGAGFVLTFILMLLTAVILGIFHCIPIMLNYHDFPGHTQDHRLWTAFAILTTVLPLGPILLVAAEELYDSFDNRVTGLVYKAMFEVSALSLPLYATARIALMALAAKQLTDLPPSALRQVEWTTLIPHFGA
ncbi:hypothetical protein PQX77_011166 [Marasmius sp. AFHP31]|nr:hypothetical protein PQX77_011166 [Marasmius sp. AFHP31]